MNAHDAVENRSTIDALNELIARDYDAIAAYESAIYRLQDADDREQLRMFMADHVRHTHALSSEVRRLGGMPRTRGTLLRLLDEGKVLLAGLLDDQAILVAVKSNERQLFRAHERVLAHPHVSGSLQSLLRDELAEEARHRNWIDARLSSLAHASSHP